MRISDWSSDVCSSDLASRRGDRFGKELGEDLPCPFVCTDQGSCLDHKAPRRAVVEHARLCVEAAIREPVGQHGHAKLRPIRIGTLRSEEHTSELQSLMRISYAVFCLKKTN